MSILKRASKITLGAAAVAFAGTAWVALAQTPVTPLPAPSAPVVTPLLPKAANAAPSMEIQPATVGYLDEVAARQRRIEMLELEKKEKELQKQIRDLEKGPSTAATASSVGLLPPPPTGTAVFPGLIQAPSVATAPPAITAPSRPSVTPAAPAKTETEAPRHSGGTFPSVAVRAIRGGPSDRTALIVVNGETLTVHPGSEETNTYGRVISITEQGVVFSKGGQKKTVSIKAAGSTSVGGGSFGPTTGSPAMAPMTFPNALLPPPPTPR